MPLGFIKRAAGEVERNARRLVSDVSNTGNRILGEAAQGWTPSLVAVGTLGAVPLGAAAGAAGAASGAGSLLGGGPLALAGIQAVGNALGAGNMGTMRRNTRQAAGTLAGIERMPDPGMSAFLQALSQSRRQSPGARAATVDYARERMPWLTPNLPQNQGAAVRGMLV